MLEIHAEVILYLVIGMLYAGAKHSLLGEFHLTRSVWTSFRHYASDAIFWPLDFIHTLYLVFIK